MGANNKKIYVDCDCLHEVVSLEFDEEERFWYFSIYNYGNPTKPSLWEKICFCFHYLKTGKMYGDQIVFKDAQMIKIRNFVDENLI